MSLTNEQLLDKVMKGELCPSCFGTKREHEIQEITFEECGWYHQERDDL